MHHQARIAIVGFASLAFLAGAAQAQASLEWPAFYGASPTTLKHWASQAAVDSAGNVHVALWSENAAGVQDIEVVKYSASGATLWSRRFDFGVTAMDQPTGIAVASSGDVCVCGFSRIQEYNLVALRYDSAGNLIASTLFAGAPGNGDDAATAMAIDAQDNLVLTGMVTDATGNTDMLVQSYSPLGNLLWETRIDGAQSGYDYAMDLLIDSNGSIFVAGSLTESSVIYTDAAIVKLDANGNVQWSRALPPTASAPETFLALASDRNGGVVAGGRSQSYTGPGTFVHGLVARCDSAGNFAWVNTDPQGSILDWTMQVEIDAQGVCWALHDITLPNSTNYAALARISTSGVTLSVQPIPQAERGAGLAPGNAGQYFVCTASGAMPLGPHNYGVLSQFDVDGELNWQHQIAFGSAGVWPSGLQLGPASRAVVHGIAPSVYPGFPALTVQIDMSESPHGYCTGKVNSLGCAPRTVFTGIPSAGASSGFTMRVEQMRNLQRGLFLYSTAGSAATPLGGGLLCVGAPLRRTVPLGTGGSLLPVQDCSGVASVDLNAFAHGLLGGVPVPELLVPGTQVWMQAWSRDGGFAPPNNQGLSGGLTFAILP